MANMMRSRIKKATGSATVEKRSPRVKKAKRKPSYNSTNPSSGGKKVREVK